MLYSICRGILIFLCKAFFQFKAYGRENIPKTGGFILASNHSSYLDPLVLGVACPRSLNFMARHDLFSNPFFARFIRAVGAFPVKRDSADASALKEAIRRVKSGGALVLFPEGSRRIDGVSFEPQSGVGFLAAKSQVAVIPAYIKGTYEAFPKGAKFIKPARVSVRFGEQISLERRQPYSDIAKEIMAKINSLS